MNLIIKEVAELTRPRWRDVAQRNGIAIEMQKELGDDLPVFWGDSSDLREAFTNLIFNSVDALPQGGVITLVTKFIPDPGSEGQIQVEVRDNGIGMDENIRQRCLEPFFTTKGQRGGTGLGLAMVYGMMQRHDGVIEIESSPGRGTCIRLTFPVRKKISGGAREAATQDKSQRILNILCIDDEAHIRQLLNDCLGHFNHHVTLAANGKEGLELFRAANKTKSPYEVVITDLGMPDVDGNQVARQVKAESPLTPIIMFTGWGTAIRDNNEAAPEVDALVNKPPHIHQLNDLLLRLTDPDRRKS
jgi:CheY-like chemotaxis protein